MIKIDLVSPRRVCMNSSEKQDGCVAFMISLIFGPTGRADRERRPYHRSFSGESRSTLFAILIMTEKTGQPRVPGWKRSVLPHRGHRSRSNRDVVKNFQKNGIGVNTDRSGIRRGEVEMIEESQRSARDRLSTSAGSRSSRRYRRRFDRRSKNRRRSRARARSAESLRAPVAARLQPL